MVWVTSDNPDIPTFESEGYDKEDWLPVFEPFDEHDRFFLDGYPTITHEEYLLSEENETGAQVIYYVPEGPGGLWVEYSPIRRRDDGEMLWGTIEFGGVFENSYVAEKHEQILQTHATAYTMPTSNFQEDLGEISVPEGFDEDELYATVQACEDIIDDAQRLQEELKEETQNFQPSDRR